MSTRDNTKVIQAHIPEELKMAFDTKLISDKKTIQQWMEEKVKEYTSQK